MNQQLIISVGREYGSGGRMIAKELAERFGLPMYDSNLLDELAKERNLDAEEMRRFDETPNGRFTLRMNAPNAPADRIARLQFRFLREKADRGDSFVVVGRCAESVLRGYEGMFSIFVLAEKSVRIPFVMQLDHVNEEEAETLINHMDKKRRDYHNAHCLGKWGDSRTYDICIDSGKLGIPNTVDALEHIIRAWIKNREDSKLS